MIDWTRIEELKSDFGDEGLAELLPIFEDEIAEAIRSIEAQKDAGQIEATGHFIKGSAANLGLSELGDLCNQIELAAKSGTVLTTEIGKLSRQFSTAMDQLKSRL